MPYYLFRCQDCGDFIVWVEAIKEINWKIECRHARNIAKRIFNSAYCISDGNGQLKQTIEVKCSS